MGTRPDLRIGDADREACATALREHYAQGRLSIEEFNERLDAVFAAATQGALDQITSDLPQVSGRSFAPLPAPTLPPGRSGGGSSSRDGTGHRDHGGRRDRRGYRDHGGNGWTGVPPHRARSFGALALLPALLLLLVVSVEFRFPLPGSLGVFVGTLLLVRSILRRVFGGRRR